MPDYEKIADELKPPIGAPITANLERVIDPDQQREWYDVNHPRYQGLAEAKGYDQSNPKTRLQSLRYSHEAMIDVIIAQPGIKQNELAEIFERGVPWISRIIGSDAFQAALAKRREEITDPFLIATVEERMGGLAMQSLDIITERLEKTRDTDKGLELAVKGLEISAKAFGYGARNVPGQTNQFIIQLPPKAANSSDWAETHSPLKQLSGDSNG